MLKLQAYYNGKWSDCQVYQTTIRDAQNAMGDYLDGPDDTCLQYILTYNERRISFGDLSQATEQAKRSSQPNSHLKILLEKLTNRSPQ